MHGITYQNICVCRGDTDMLDLHDYNASGPGVILSTPSILAPSNETNVGTGGVLISVVGEHHACWPAQMIHVCMQS